MYTDKGGRGHKGAIEQYLTIDMEVGCHNGNANGGLEGGGKNDRLCKEMCP